MALNGEELWEGIKLQERTGHCLSNLWMKLYAKKQQKNKIGMGSEKKINDNKITETYRSDFGQKRENIAGEKHN